MSTQADGLPGRRPHQSFASLRHAGYRAFFVGSATAMLADSIEHVISYWVVFQKFHSPALGGFAVVSHWLPFLIFSVPVGGLADRRDPRRLIQLGMLLFMFVSVAWATLFVTDTLQMWHAMALLVIHGWPACCGSAGPGAHSRHRRARSTDKRRAAHGDRALSRHVDGPGCRCGAPARARAVEGSLRQCAAVHAADRVAVAGPLWQSLSARKNRPPCRAAIRRYRDDRSKRRRQPADCVDDAACGAASFFVGNSYQAQMPGFAYDLGHGDPGLSYSMLLGADAAGALSAGFVLESRGLLRPAPRTACVLAMLWCCALGSFALIGLYPLALVLLFAAGFLELSFNTMAQTLVQLHAPPAIRGRVIGLFSMTSLGFRTFSGLSVGLAGSAIGIHRSLALSAAAVFIVIGVLLAVTGRTASGVRVAGEPSG
jgi:MFS family permease